MTSNLSPTDIIAIRNHLAQFSHLTTPPDLSPEQALQIGSHLQLFNDLSDYQTIGVCASTLGKAKAAMESFLAALGIPLELSLPDRQGAIYLKFNTLNRAWYLDSYHGPSRGVLITFHSSEPEAAEAGTYGPFPFDLFASS